MVSTLEKICSSNSIISPNFRGENKQFFELPPPRFKQIQHKHTAWQIWETSKPTNLTIKIGSHLMTPAPCVKNPPVIFQPTKRGPLGLKPCVVASPTSVRHPLKTYGRIGEEMEPGNSLCWRVRLFKLIFYDLFTLIFCQVMAVCHLYYTRSTKRKSGWHVPPEVTWSSYPLILQLHTERIAWKMYSSHIIWIVPLPSNSHHPDCCIFSRGSL